MVLYCGKAGSSLHMLYNKQSVIEKGYCCKLFYSFLKNLDQKLIRLLYCLIVHHFCHKIKLCFKVFLLLVMTLMFSQLSYALTSKTVQIIQGNKPYLDLDDLFSFKAPITKQGVINITPSKSNEILWVSANTKFNQVETKVIADGVAKNISTIEGLHYGDIDGDEFTSIKDVNEKPPVLGKLTAIWSYKDYDGTTKTVTADQLNSIMDSCLSPYTLTISSNNISVQTKYGIPYINDYGSFSKIYTIKVDEQQICHIKPGSLRFFDSSRRDQYNTCNSTNCKFANGYNPAVFQPYRGYSPTASKKFPTTGFNYANFTLKMSNAQTDYSFSSSNPSLAPITSEGVVTLRSDNRPTIPFTITLTARTKAGSPLEQKTFSYTFTVSKWARPLPSTQYKMSDTMSSGDNIFPAANACSGKPNGLGVISASVAASYLFSITDLTNAPSAKYAVTGNGTGFLPAWIENKEERLSRDIDGTFAGEWGELYKAYPNSNFDTSTGCTWSNQAYTDKLMFSTDIETGYVGYNLLQLAQGCTPICR